MNRQSMNPGSRQGMPASFAVAVFAEFQHAALIFHAAFGRLRGGLNGVAAATDCHNRAVAVAGCAIGLSRARAPTPPAPRGGRAGPGFAGVSTAAAAAGRGRRMRYDILKSLGLDHLDAKSPEFLTTLERMQREALESLQREAEPPSDAEGDPSAR
jgi:hypothetical protein